MPCMPGDTHYFLGSGLSHTQSQFSLRHSHPHCNHGQVLTLRTPAFYELGTTIISDSQVRKLRHREVNWAAQGHRDKRNSRKTTQSGVCPTWKPCPHTAQPSPPLTSSDCACLPVGVVPKDPKDDHSQHKMDHFPEIVYVPSLAVLLDISSMDGTAH